MVKLQKKMRFKFKEKRIGNAVELSKIMDNVLKETGLDEDYFVHYLKRNWNLIVGELISTHSIPIKKYGNYLLIYADHSVFANDIGLMKTNIIENIRKMNANIRIDDIKVEVSKKIIW
jgi:hypothetical protein